MDAIVSNGFVMESDQLIQKTKVFFGKLCVDPKLGSLEVALPSGRSWWGNTSCPTSCWCFSFIPMDTCANQKGKDYCKQATSLDFLLTLKDYRVATSRSQHPVLFVLYAPRKKKCCQSSWAKCWLKDDPFVGLACFKGKVSISAALSSHCESLRPLLGGKSHPRIKYAGLSIFRTLKFLWISFSIL